LLVTSLNLIPAGQLDGGHILYTLIDKKGMRIVYPVILTAMVALGFLWNGWFLWAALIFLLGRSYAEPLDQITQLDNRRKWMARAMIVIFILVFIPIPIILVGA
jgi:membrane-associated protease RseP (regulator of RpoE activity)